MHKWKQNVMAVGKERRESLVRAKRFCRVRTRGESDGDVLLDSEIVIDEEQSILDAHCFCC